MNKREWQQRWRVWRERELAERSGDLEGVRPSIQVAITEQAIRELYDRVEALENKGVDDAAAEAGQEVREASGGKARSRTVA